MFGDYAESWLRRRDLKPRTRDHYRALLDHHIVPAFAVTPLVALSPRMVAE